MAQFGRPDADTFNGGWTDEAAGAVDIFNSIDESVPSDADFIQSPLNPAAVVYVCHLSAVTDPQSLAQHTGRIRAFKQPAGGAQIDLTVELREGYVDEVTQGTLLDGLFLQDIANVPTDFQFPLADPTLIGDYSNLFLRFVAQQV